MCICQSQSPKLFLPPFPPGNYKIVYYMYNSTWLFVLIAQWLPEGLAQRACLYFPNSELSQSGSCYLGDISQKHLKANGLAAATQVK